MQRGTVFGDHGEAAGEAAHTQNRHHAADQNDQRADQRPQKPKEHGLIEEQEGIEDRAADAFHHSARASGSLDPRCQTSVGKVGCCRLFRRKSDDRTGLGPRVA